MKRWKLGGLSALLLLSCQTAPATQTEFGHRAHNKGRLLLPVSDQNTLLLSSGQLTLFSKERQKLATLTLSENNFQVPLLDNKGPYLFEGQGTIQDTQSPIVPISGSQGGILPISGSQGGLLPFLIASAPFQKGQQIAFEGEIQEDLSLNLDETFTAKVQPEKIEIIHNTIHNENSPLNNSTQVIIQGSTQGNITIVNGEQRRLDPAPRIDRIQIEPMPSETHPLQLKLSAILKGVELQEVNYLWQASHGTLSSPQEANTLWQARSPQTSEVSFKLTIQTSSEGFDSKTRMHTLQNSPQK